MMERRMKTSASQWAVLLDFMEKNPEIVTRKFSGPFSKQKYDNLWKDITNMLNSMGYGTKTEQKYQEAFTKYKSKVKAKALAIKCGMAKTGGGGAVTPLNQNEEKLMAILGWKSVTGDETMELGLPEENDLAVGNSGTYTNEQNQPSCSTGPVEPPPLLFLNESIENDYTLPTSDQHVSGAKKRKQIGKHKKNLKSRMHDNITLAQMHHENLSVLKEINVNVSRLADSQEELCSVMKTFLELIT